MTYIFNNRDAYESLYRKGTVQFDETNNPPPEALQAELEWLNSLQPAEAREIYIALGNDVEKHDLNERLNNIEERLNRLENL